MPEVKTLGESRVLVQYKDDDIQQQKIQRIRELSAELIDLLNEDKNTRTDNGQAMLHGEVARVYAHAMTVIEDACMWSIKAICK